MRPVVQDELAPADPRLTARSGRGVGAPLTWLGVTMLILAVGATIALPPGPPAVVFAGLATSLLATDRRLGPLGAALLVVLAIPFGRAADNDLLRLAGVPIRPHDVAIGLGILLALPRLRTPRRLDAAMAAVLAFVAVGVVAAVIGLVGDNAIRDVLRDLRWWFLYGTALVAFASNTTRSSVLRGLLAGAAVYAIVMVVALVLPDWDGGIKARALEYGWGTARLQFSNSPFVIAAAAYVAVAHYRRPRFFTAAALALLALATALSLTRMSLVVLAGALVLAGVLALAWSRHEVPWRRLVTGLATATAAVLLAVPMGLVLVGLVPAAGVAALLPWTADGSSETPAPGSPGGSVRRTIDRVLFQDEQSDVTAIGAGRFSTYREAWAVIVAAPLVGGGLGTMTDTALKYGGSEPATEGRQPGVDDAYLTVAMKGGFVGAASYTLMMLAPLWVAVRRLGRRRLTWFLPAWLAILALTVTQSFASSGYGPFAVALLLAYPSLGPTRSALRRR